MTILKVEFHNHEFYNRHLNHTIMIVRVKGGEYKQVINLKRFPEWFTMFQVFMFHLQEAKSPNPVISLLSKAQIEAWNAAQAAKRILYGDDE